MTDYDALNARLYSERNREPKFGSPEWRQAMRSQTYDNLREVERLAKVFHKRWESHGFPGNRWLEVEGGPKLACKVTLDGPNTSPDDYDLSSTYVMIDGRLMHYFKREYAARFEGAAPRPSTIDFLPYREHVDRSLESGTNMTFETSEHIKRLTHMIDML